MGSFWVPFEVILGTFWGDFGYLLDSFWGLELLLGAKGAPEGPGADFSSILASILVSLGGLWAALGVLWEASGSLWAPKWRRGATKEGTKDLQERFCGHLKNLRKNMVFGAPRSSKSDPGGMRDHVFGDLGEHFSGLGGSWEQVGILMDFGNLPGTTQIETTQSSGA